MNQPIEKRFHLHACGVQQSFFDKAEAAREFEEIKKIGFAKKKVGVGIGATPTWGYCVCCYQNRRNPNEKVSNSFEININKHSHK